MSNRIKDFKDFFNSLDLLLFVLDLDGNIVYCNKSACDRLDYKFSELVGKSILEIHPIERRLEADEVINRIISGDESNCFIPIISKNGSLIDVETKIAKGFWEEKEVLFGVVKDVSELRLSNDKFSMIFKFSPVAMAITRISDGKFIETNDTWHRLTGYSREDIENQTVYSLRIYHDKQDREKMLDILRKDGYIENYPINFKRKDGSDLYGSISATPIMIGTDLCWITAFLDQTHEKEVEKSLEDFRAKVIKDARDNLMNLLDNATLVK